MESRKFIIDFESLLGKDGEYVVKELSIISNVEPFRFGRTMFFKAPYSWSRLSTKTQRTNRWLIYQRHGLRWDAGTVEYSHLYTTLQSLQGDIFVKGQEKAEFITAITGREAHDLGIFGCPKVEVLRSAYMCPVPQHQCSTNCSENKVRAYAAWFEANMPSIIRNYACTAPVSGSCSRAIPRCQPPRAPSSPPEVPIRASDCYMYVDDDITSPASTSAWDD